MTLKRLLLRGNTLKPAQAPAKTDAPSGGVVTSALDRSGLRLRTVGVNFPIQEAGVALQQEADTLVREMLTNGMVRELDRTLMYGEPRGEHRIYRQDPATVGESPIDTITWDRPQIGAISMESLRYRTFRVETSDGPRIEQRVESQPAGYNTRSELPEVQDLMDRPYFGRVYASMYGIPREPRTREIYLAGGEAAAFGWRPTPDMTGYQDYVFHRYAPLLKNAELNDFFRIVEDHPNEVTPHLAYVLYCASLAKVPRGNPAIHRATELFREAMYYRCPLVVSYAINTAQPLSEVLRNHLPHHFICGTEVS